MPPHRHAGPAVGMLPGVLMLMDSQGLQRPRGHDHGSQQCMGPGTEVWDWIRPSPLLGLHCYPTSC